MASTRNLDFAMFRAQRGVITSFNTPFSPKLGSSKTLRVSRNLGFLREEKKKKRFSSNANHELLKPQCTRSTTSNGQGNVHDVSDVQNSASNQEGSNDKGGSQQTKPFAASKIEEVCSLGGVDIFFEETVMRKITINQILQPTLAIIALLKEKLRRYGISGILSYGLLNTFYYLTTFLLVWFYVAPAPGKMGFVAAAERFIKIMAMVWAGSQVTKLVRAGGALALAPFADRGLSWFTKKFRFESRGKAFIAIVGVCIGMVLVLFLMVTVLWA